MLTSSTEGKEEGKKWEVERDDHKWKFDFGLRLRRGFKRVLRENRQDKGWVVLQEMKCSIDLVRFASWFSLENWKVHRILQFGLAQRFRFLKAVVRCEMKLVSHRNCFLFLFFFGFRWRHANKIISAVKILKFRAVTVLNVFAGDHLNLWL